MDEPRTGEPSRRFPPATDLKGQTLLLRIVVLRFIAFIFSVAFLVSLHQNKALIGPDGLTPATAFLDRVLTERCRGDRWACNRAFPSIFWWLPPTDANLDLVAASGLATSGFVLLTGAGNVPLLLGLWAAYSSLVNVGQTWFGFGWESQLLETGFWLAWLCPWLRLFPRISPGDVHSGPGRSVVVWSQRWLLFRIMLGAGLIKLRGDSCWRDLTCMQFHYQTQPVPNPLSPLLHRAPAWWHTVETLGNHVVELAAPWLLLMSREARHLGGVVQVLFQAVLITSGNLSFLNWLTIAPALCCFDDCFWAPLFAALAPATLQRVHRSLASGQTDLTTKDKPAATSWARLHRTLRVAWAMALALLLAVLSGPVVQNLLSSQQAMNTSFDSLRIVNSYGAFGSVTKTRTEVVLQGTLDDLRDPKITWHEYEFHCKPGNTSTAPCLITPYHYRLDWLMWFAAFQNYGSNPWLIHLMIRLQRRDPLVRSLLARDPFEDADRRPAFVRAVHFEYTFADPAAAGRVSVDDPDHGEWWDRKELGEYVPAITEHNPSVREFLAAHGWK